MPPPESTTDRRGTLAQSTAARARAAALSDVDLNASTIPVVRVEGYEIERVLGRGTAVPFLRFGRRGR